VLVLAQALELELAQEQEQEQVLVLVLAQGQAQVTCPPKRSPVIMLVKQDKKGGINGQENLHSGANHQQAEGS